jgi:hypothetical protein
MTEPEVPVVIIVPEELHLTESNLENVRAAHWIVREVNDLIRADFVEFIGDNVQDATRLNTQESRPAGLSAAQIDRFGGEVGRALAEGQRVSFAGDCLLFLEERFNTDRWSSQRSDLVV